MLKNLHCKYILAAALCAAVLLPATASAKKLTLLYVPLDNRPVCVDYVKETMEAVDLSLIHI